jgi:hypothetical protein
MNKLLIATAALVTVFSMPASTVTAGALTSPVGHMGGGSGSHMSGGPKFGGQMGGGPSFAGHMGGGGPSSSGPSGGRGPVASHNAGNGNHLDNNVVHDDGQFKIVHNPNVDNLRLNGNHLDNNVVHDDGHFKIVHDPNFHKRRFNNFFFVGGGPSDVSACWVWWPDDGWVWQCS